MCHVSFLAAPDTDHKHKFSLTQFIHFSHLSDGLSRTFPSSLCRQVAPSRKTCRVAETHAPQFPQVMSPKYLRLSQGSQLILEIHTNYMMYRKRLEKKITELLSITEEVVNLENLGQLAYRFLKYQGRPTSNCRCISTIPSKALETLLSKMVNYKRCRLHHCVPRKLRRNPMQWSCRREKQVHKMLKPSEKKVWGFLHLKVRKLLAKPNALFSSEQGILIRSSVFRNANPSNLRGSLLEGNKGHLLNQARSDLAKQELHVESLDECIGELQRQTGAKIDTHEMGEMKRAQELRVDEFSVQYLRESHWDKTKAHFTIAGNARTDEFCEWLRGISRSGIESQWEIVLRSQRLHFSTTPRAAGSVTGETCCKRWRANWEHNSNADICKKAVDHEFFFASGYSTEPYGWTAKTANFGTSIWQIPLIPNNSWLRGYDSKIKVTTCSDFPSEAMLWIKEVEMVNSVVELNSSRSVSGKNFPNFEMLDSRIASALNKIILTFQRNWSPSIQLHQCLESWNSEKKKVADVPYASMPRHRTQNSCSAEFTQQISSVSTKQFQAGVKSSLNGLRNKKSRLWRSSWQKKTSSWKMWRRKKGILWCKLQGATIGQSGNRLREWIQRFETLEKEIQFSRVCGDATLARRVSVGMSYKTVPDVDDGLGDRTRACREYTLPREDINSRIYATIPGQTIIDQVLQVHIIRYLGIGGIETQIPSTTTKERTSWVVIWRGKNCYVEELHLNDPDHNPKSSELLLERSVAKEKRTQFNKNGGIIEHGGNSCETVENSDESNVQLFRRKLFLLKKGSGMTFLPVNISEDILLKPESQNCSWDWYVIMINTKGKQTVPEGWRAQIFGLWLASVYLQKKEQD